MYVLRNLHHHTLIRDIKRQKTDFKIKEAINQTDCPHEEKKKLMRMVKSKRKNTSRTGKKCILIPIYNKAHEEIQFLKVLITKLIQKFPKIFLNNTYVNNRSNSKNDNVRSKGFVS